MEIIGHRGCEGLAPENSIEAMQKAIDLRIDRVEFDIQLTKDGKLILFHDAKVHTSSQRFSVKDLSYQELLHKASMTNNEVPELHDVLRVCKDRIAIQAELKSPGIEEQVWFAIQDAGFPIEDVSISSFNFEWLKNVKKIAGCLQPSQLVLLHRGSRIPRLLVKKMRLHGVGSISFFSGNLSKQLVNHARDLGFRILAFGIKDKQGGRSQVIKTYAGLIRMEIDGFTCAYPDILKEILSGEQGG